MYENYFNLNDRPFKDSTSPKYLYLSKKHLEILESFKYAVEHGTGFLMLTGEVGTGKTSIIKRFVMEIGNDFIVAILTYGDLELNDFFKILAAELGLGIKIDSKTDFLIGFKEFLHKAHDKGKNVILIIDEAHKLRQNLLDEIRMLSNIKAPNYKMLNIIFVGQTKFNDLISEPQNLALRQRISQNYFLEPLSKDETLELILHRINCAGATSKIFSADALQSIHQYTSGYPRLIVALCDTALLCGYAKSVRLIEKDIIDECAKDLNILGFELRNEIDEHSEKFSPIEFNIEEPYQNKPKNIICDLRNKIKTQKHQKSVKVKKWQLSLACGILIVLTSVGAYFVKEIINTKAPILSEKQKMIQIVKNYSIDKDSRLNFNDSNQNVLKANEALAEKKKSSSDVIPSVATTNSGEIASQKEILPNTIKIKANMSSNTNENEVELNRKNEKVYSKRSLQETQQVENIQAGKTTQAHKSAIAKSNSSDNKRVSIKAKLEKSDKIQSAVMSAPIENKAIAETKVSEAKVDKISQISENKHKIMLEKKSKVDSSVQQNSQKEEPPKESGPSQNNASYTSQIETNTIEQSDNNAQKFADLNESSVMNQQIFSQGSTKIETASILYEKSGTVTLKDKVQVFLQKYCDTYKSKQLDNFLAYFSVDAKENGKPFNALIPKYRRNFEAIETIEYNITLEKISHDKISDSVRLEGKFNLRWQPYNSPWRENSGKIFMDLLKNDDSFTVLNLDYYGSHPKK